MRSPSTRLFDDPFASAFVDWRFRWALDLSRWPVIRAAVPWSLIDGHWSGSRGTVVARTRYLDDLVGDALAVGVEQIVILGAGFDSRAYRIRGIDGARVFELDHQVTQARKRAVVVRRLGTVPDHVRLVPIDFAETTLEAVVARHGYRVDARTFFVCEGVTHYLSAGSVDTMFRSVARLAPVGSRMAFTYIHRGVLDGSRTFDGADTTLAVVRRGGEPYTWGCDPAGLRAYVAERGFELIEDVGAGEYRDRYLRPLGRGGEPLSGFQRAALVEIVP